MGVRRACLESVPRGGTYPSPVLQSVKKKKKKLQARPSPNYPIIMSVIGDDDDDDDNNNNVSTSARQHFSTSARQRWASFQFGSSLLDSFWGGEGDTGRERWREGLTFCDVIRGADFIYITWRYMYPYGCISLIGIQRCHSNDLLYLKTQTPHPPMQYVRVRLL